MCMEETRRCVDCTEMNGNIPKNSGTRRAKFSKPLQRGTPQGGKHAGMLRVCERKVNELRRPLAALLAQRRKICGLRNEPTIH